MASVTSPMNNGVGRFVCQLKRLTLQYCYLGGSSKGMRWASIRKTSRTVTIDIVFVSIIGSILITEWSNLQEITQEWQCMSVTDLADTLA